MSNIYITTEELSEKIKYDQRTIRESLKDTVLLEGVHYVKPFGGRKILYIWNIIEQDMLSQSQLAMAIPMADGGTIYG